MHFLFLLCMEVKSLRRVILALPSSYDGAFSDNNYQLNGINYFHGKNAPENLKSLSTIFFSNFFFSPNDSPSKTMKDGFYFI